jgi:hypothetical protein
MRLKVRMLALGEREPATLALIHGLPTLLVYDHVYQPGQLPKHTKILVPPLVDIPADDRPAALRLLEAARRQGFELVDDVRARDAQSVTLED